MRFLLVLFPLLRHFLLLSAALLPTQAGAFELTVEILDAEGIAISDAVIEVPLTPASPSQELAVIDQVNRRFVPMVIAIHQGQYVNFPNNDNIRHHVYSFSEAKNFSTELYANEPIAPIHFDRTGIAVLGCNIHDSMVGYVFVSPWQDIAVSGEDGRASFTALATRPDTINIWHPWADSGQVLSVDTSKLSDADTLTITLDVEVPQQNFGFRALRD